MDSGTATLGLIVLLLTLVVIIIVAQFLRRRRDLLVLRPIAAYRMLPSLAGRSVEASRPIHISLGSAGLGDASTLLAVAGAELAYHVVAQAAISDAPPIFTLTSASAFPLAQDTLRRAYASRQLVERYRSENVRWYPAGGRSLAFAAAITALHTDDSVAADVLVGSYGAELGLILDSAHRHALPTLAVSDQLEGQAVAWALAEYPLIGEEVFAAGSYLQGASVQLAESVAVDLLRWLLILAMLAAFLTGILQNGG